jgi:type I restriction enzyme, S subunit
MNNKANTTNMNPKQQRHLTPQLRFPEFQDASEWNEKKISDFANLISERAGENKYTLMSVTAGVGLVTQMEKFGKEIAGKSYKNYFVIRDGDFTYNKSATKDYPEGFISMLQGRNSAAVPNSIFLCFSIEDENINRQFLNHMFFANHHGPWLRKFITIGARAHGALNINADDLMRMPIRLPAPSEQQKIAECLTSLDDLIIAQTQKLAALQAHKKGLLQKLFPAEGQTLPQLRFPEFQDAGEWVNKPLGDLLLSHPNYGVNAPAVPYSENLPTYMRITDISEEGYYLIDNKVSVDVDAKDDNSLSEGDVVLARTGASVGKSYKYREDDGELVFAGYLIRIKPDQNKLNSSFLFNFLSTYQYWNWVIIMSVRGGQPGINATEYASLIIPTPPTNKNEENLEQQKIADCLSALDELIAAQTQKLETLQIHKKGLMQQLFPSPDMP